MLVGGQGEELDELLTDRHFFEDLAGQPHRGIGSPFGFHLADHLIGDRPDEGAGYGSPTVGVNPMSDPLPDLGTGDLGGGDVFH